MATLPTLQLLKPSLAAAVAASGYTDHVHALQKRALAAGIPYGVVNELVFVHPDGPARESDEPNSRIAA